MRLQAISSYTDEQLSIKSAVCTFKCQRTDRQTLLEAVLHSDLLMEFTL